MSCSELEIEKIFDSKTINPAILSIYTADEQNRIDTIFFSGEVRPLTWYTLNPLPFEVLPTGGKDTRTYIPPVDQSYLLGSYLWGEVPAISVKPEHQANTRIAWCRNLMHEIVESATCIGGSLRVGFDRQWLVTESEFFLKPGFESDYDRGVGNTPDLQEFKVALPHRNLRTRQPWFYNCSSAAAFPLYKLNSQSSLTHNYKYKLKIADLLRMVTLDNGHWVTSPLDLTRLQGLPEGGLLKTPTLWGNFGKVNENEVKWNKCNRKIFPIYADTVVSKDSIPVKCGSSVPLELQSEGPCKGIFWSALNRTAASINIRSNYTTSLSDPTTGDSPITTCDLMFGEIPKFEEMHVDHFNGPLLYGHTTRAPRTSGIYGFVFTHDIEAYGHNVAINLNDVKAKFIPKLEDPDTTKWNVDSNDIRGEQTTPPCNHEFTITVRMLVMHKFTIDETGKITREY